MTVVTTMSAPSTAALAVAHGIALIPRDTYATIPAATSVATVPFDRWRELNADGLVVGTVQKVAAGVQVEVRLFNVRTRQSAFARVMQPITD